MECSHCKRNNAKDKMKVDDKIYFICATCMAYYRKWLNGRSYPGDGSDYWKGFETKNGKAIS